MSREKTNLQDDHRILLEDIARAKLEKRVLWSRLSREAEEPKTRPPTENVDANVIEENPKIEWSEIMYHGNILVLIIIGSWKLVNILNLNGTFLLI